MTDEEAWVAEERAQMREHLTRAANHFGASIIGTPVDGWYCRSMSARVAIDTGQHWLRVGREFITTLTDEAVADFWTGNRDANAIEGVTKPRVIASAEWDDTANGDRRVRADLMTLLPGRPCSSTDALRTQLDLPDSWWVELRRSIDIIRATPTTRYASRPADSSRSVRAVFGDDVAAKFRPTVFETAHSDLHWSNLFAPPEFAILDWELWGPGPAGRDPATLYLFALLVPAVAEKVHAVFTDLLDSPAGHAAQLGVAGRILRRAEEGENTDLADAVRRHAETLIARRSAD